MKLFITFVVAMLWIGQAFAQPNPDTLWIRTYGGSGSDLAQSVCQTTDGGYVLAGWTTSFGAGSYDSYVVKTNDRGDTLWTRTYGGSGDDRAYSIRQTADGGYVIAGSTTSFGAGGTDFYVVKTNARGDTLWTRTYGGSAADVAFSIRQTTDSGYVIAGTTGSFGAGNTDFWLVKTSSEGDSLWSWTYGGYAADACLSVQQATDGGCLLAGYTESLGAGSMDFWLVKTDAQGNNLWSRSYGGYSYDVCLSVVQTADGGYVLAGYTGSSGAGGMDSWLVKTNAQGDSLWSRTYGGNTNDYCLSVLQTADGGYVLAGYTRSFGAGDADFWLVKTDAQGDSLWSWTYGGAGYDVCTSVIQTADGGYVLAGHTQSFGAGSDDYYVVKTGPDSQSRGVRVLNPNGGENWQIFEQDTVKWAGYGFTGLVRIELNRNYSSGTWEVLRDTTANDGIEPVFVTDPLSTHCRVRISAIGDTLSDISDGDFSITSSQGYLALARVNTQNTPVLNWSPAVIDCPQVASEWFHLKNFGSEAIVVFRPLEPPSAEFSRATTCDSFVSLAPSQMSACSLRLVFDPASDGTYRDTLLIQTDAVNGVGGYVRIPLSGTQISTPAAPQVVITIAGNDARLNWNRITQSIGGCPVTVTGYEVFDSPALGGPYCYLGFATDTSYTHVRAVQFAGGMFYQVVSFAGTLSFLEGIERGEEMEEVFQKMKN